MDVEWLSDPSMNDNLLELRELVVSFIAQHSDCTLTFFKIPKDINTIERAMRVRMPKGYRSGGSPDRIIRVQEMNGRQWSWKSFRVRNLISFTYEGAATRMIEPELKRIDLLIRNHASFRYVM